MSGERWRGGLYEDDGVGHRDELVLYVHHRLAGILPAAVELDLVGEVILLRNRDVLRVRDIRTIKTHP